MREIKFRAWNDMDEKMIQWHGMHLEKDGDEKKLSVVVYEDSMGNYYDDFPLMQYTGSKDVNGREVYEGDVVIRTIVAPSTTNEDFIGEVKFYEGRWWMDNGRDAVPLWSESDEIKVIGNIYENPELVA